jgi:hypothetical protein
MQTKTAETILLDYLLLACEIAMKKGDYNPETDEYTVKLDGDLLKAIIRHRTVLEY